MKIAISATGTTLDTEIDPRFGRCQYFIIADPGTLEFEAIDNSSATATGGAGISAAQMIVDKGVEAVLTGNCGPNAYQVLSAAKIQVIPGVSGNIEDVIKDYRSGIFQASTQANVPDHFGMGGDSGMGRGMGMGRGGGHGMGRGMSREASTPPPVSPTPPSQSPEEELETLKAQSQVMAQQLAEIQRRIEGLEKGK